MRNRIARLVASLVVLGGPAVTSPACGGNVVVDPPSKSPGSTDTTPDKSTGPAPPSIERPANAACWFGGHATNVISLRTRAGGPAFVRFYGKWMSAALPVGPASHAVVDVEDGALELRGVVEPADIDLRAARPFVMNEFVVPVWGRLSWIEGVREGLIVTIPAPAAVIPAKPPLKAQISCEDVRLRPFTQDRLDAEAAVFGDRQGEWMHLRSGLEMALSSTYDGPPVATLRAPEGNPIVSVYETRGERSRISWEHEDLLIFGWINTTGLMPRPPLGVSRRGSPGPPLATHFVSVPTVEQVWCASDIAVVAEVEGQLTTVGRVRRESVITIVQWGRTLSRIWWHRPSWMDEEYRAPFYWIVPTENAKLLGRSRDLHACTSLTR